MQANSTDAEFNEEKVDTPEIPAVEEKDSMKAFDDQKTTSNTEEERLKWSKKVDALRQEESVLKEQKRKRMRDTDGAVSDDMKEDLIELLRFLVLHSQSNGSRSPVCQA